MPKSAREKCRLCAKLDMEGAIARHGPAGTGCWEGDKCHKRRTYYRNRDRYNKDRRHQYAIETGRIVPVISVPVPESIAAIVHLYRTTKSSALHAIAAELLRSGVLVAKVEPVHTLGWTATQVKDYLRAVLRSFSEQVGEEVGQFEAQVEHDPRGCPIADCPLQGE